MAKISSMGAYQRSDSRGFWKETLAALGASPSYFTGYNIPCPFCGGEDRFRWIDGTPGLRRNGQGVWVCSQCQSKTGDGIEFIKRLRNCSYAEARELRNKTWDSLGAQPPTELLTAPPVNESEAIKQYAQGRLQDWLQAVPLTQWNPAGKYLQRRTGIVPWTDDLRVQRPKDKDKAGKRYIFTGDDAILIALVRSNDGGMTLHRTYIKGGKKVGVRYAPGPMPAGGAVQLLPIDGRGVLGIGEGIETALSAAKLFDVPVWAALDARNLSRWEPPAEARSIMIFADNDENGVGQDAAELRDRLSATGLQVEIKLPEVMGQDWNDIYQSRLVEPAYMKVLQQQRETLPPAASAGEAA
jgi:putative DNA primase/helicase